MVTPIVSPSVLASNFGQLSAECKRMIKNGADWLHMGEIGRLLSVSVRSTEATISSFRCHGWVSSGHVAPVEAPIDARHALRSDTSCLTLRWVRSSTRMLRVTTLIFLFCFRSSHSEMCKTGYSRYLHGLPHDGVRPRARSSRPPSSSLWFY